jgi:hypothetical protein
MLAGCETAQSTPAARGYTVGTFACLAVYMATLFGVTYAVKADLLSGPALYAAAAAPGIAVAAQLLVTLRYMERSDEFIRALLAKRFIVAATLTFAGFTVWGFLEQFAGVQHVPAWWVYPVFWAVMGGLSPFIRSSR